MKLILTLTNSNQSQTLEASNDVDISTLRNIIEALTSVPASDQQLWCNNIELNNLNKTLNDYHIKEDDVILIRQHQKAIFTAADIASAMKNVSNANAMSSNSMPSSFHWLNTFLAMPENPNISVKKEDVRRALSQNNFSHPAVLQLQEEMKQFTAIEESFQKAMEYHPESFVSVPMLYIDFHINKVPVQVLVDSGAQVTLMSMACAKKCQLSHLIDKRFAGQAQGVGSAAVLGRIHLVDIKIGHSYLPCTFSVLQEIGPDCILGLDMLKRHQCLVDLKKYVLHVGDVETPFVHEIELEKRQKLKKPLLDGLQVSHGIASASPSNTSTTTVENNIQDKDRLLSTTSNSAVDLPRTSSNNTTKSTQAPLNNTEAGYKNDSMDEHSIQTLVDLGVSRAEAMRALAMTNGNVEQAAGFLFN